VFIDDRDDLDRAAVGGGIELEVDGPHLVRCVGFRQAWSGAGAQAFTSAALRHPQALFTPEPLDLLVVRRPALTTGIVIRPAEPPPWMGFRVVAQPLT
jgi:hypothetical protein